MNITPKMECDDFDLMQDCDEDDLRCTSCKEYLIVWPLYTNIETNATICGMCYKHGMEGMLHNICLESCIKRLKFPCRNAKRGCTLQLGPGELIKHHSEDCMSKYVCKFENCAWEDKRELFPTHCEEAHSVNHINEQYLFKFNPIICDTTIEYFLEAYNDFFFITVQFQSKNIVFVQCQTFSTSIKYKFALKTDDMTNEHPVNVYASDAAKPIKFHLLDPSQFHLVIMERDVKAQHSKKTIDNLNNTILGHIECPICLEYMYAPIQQCHNGHLICDSCSKKVQKCPSCGNVNYSRCLVAEKIADDLFFPCKFKECPFIDNYTAVKKHEANCVHKPYVCPLADCKLPKLYSFDDLCAHLSEKHGENLLQINTLNLYIQEAKPHEVFVSLTHNCVFLVKHKFENDMVMILVELYAPYKCNATFMFKIAIGRRKKKNMRMNFAVHHCVGEQEPFNSKLCLSLPINLVNQFIVDSMRLSYDIDIYRCDELSE